MSNRASNLNTLELSEGLQKVKFSKDQADHLALVMFQREHEFLASKLASKDDVDQLEKTLVQKIDQNSKTLRQELASVEERLKYEIKELDNKIDSRFNVLDAKFSMFQWMIGGIGFGIFILLLKAFLS